MNLKAWLKGLGVFVLSSVITALAATNLEQLNQTNGSNGARPPSGVVSALTLCLLLPSIVSLTGCVNAWERSTYATLAASKSLIDCAIAGYNAVDADIRQYCAADPGDPRFDPAPYHISRTREAQQLIEKARQVQTASVQAFEAYAVARIARDPKVSLAGKEAAVISEIADLPQLINSIRALFAKVSSANAGNQKLKSGRVDIGAKFDELRVHPFAGSPITAMTAITRSPDSQVQEVAHGK